VDRKFFWILCNIEFTPSNQLRQHNLRAAMSLSLLWQQQGKRDEARRMLADIYGWFTEGFDTADLQETEVLLDEQSN